MRLVVVSNRVPVTRDLRTVQGGLTVALLAALERHGGLWFGWDGRITPASGGAPARTQAGAVEYATIALTREDYDNYYKGYANRVLWPLFHDRVNLMEYRTAYRDGYERVNLLFARKLLPLLRPDDLIWIHDYHCFPLGRYLREAGVKQGIGLFLHIPFPPYALLRTLPQHERLLHALCAYDLVGFQTELDRHAFGECMRRTFPEGVVKWRGRTLSFAGRRVRTGAFPISIDVEDVARIAVAAEQSTQGQRLIASLLGRKLIIGVDRLDYSKGLPERFRAYGQLLEDYPGNCGNVVFLEVAQPSRGDVPEYKQIRRTLEAAAGAINGRFSEYDWMPIRYLNKSFGRSTILGFLRASHVGLVTPLRDGMNLVAKEFVASQNGDDPGVLVLSSLTGAAQEFDAALIVNPYDVHAVADAIARAIAMPCKERRARWQSLMSVLRGNDIHHWRKRFVRELEKAASA